MAKKQKQIDIVRYEPQVNVGLNNEQIKERTEHKLFNKVKQNTGKSYLRIVFENTVTFFNFIWIAIFIALVIVKSYDNLLFIIVVFLNTLISIIQECRAKMMVEKLSIVTLPRVEVMRNGEKKEIVADKLVLDDIIRLEIGNSIPADCIILEGKLEVNESMLTGESDAIKKGVGDTILSGSFIISGSCYAKVNKIGKDNYIQSIASQAKKFKSPNSNLYRDLNTIIKYIGIGIIPVGLILFINNFFSNARSIERAVTLTCGALTGMIPAGMFLLVTIALAVGVIKLSQKRTLVKDLFSIEMLARSNVLCLDKTGTITDGTMQVTEVIDLGHYKNYTNKQIMANILYNQTTTNATSNAMAIEFGKQNDFKLKYNVEFSSVRKRTSTCFEGEGTFVYGAPEFVNCELDENIKNLIYEHTSKGKRVLLLTHSNEDITDDETIPKTTPLAIITIEDHIREEAYDTIKWFKENGVKIKIISGDNPITVSNIARRVGVENAEAFVSLEGLSPTEVEQNANLFTVFGRVSPEQKHILVKTLKRQGCVVAMTGDGVNDTLALKEADCSIAMADGSDVARDLSNLVLLDSNFACLPAVVKEGRQVINNVQQSSTLYLMKTLCTILLSLFTIITLSPYPFESRQLFILELLVIGMPSVILALQPNSQLIKGDFISVVLKRSVPSGLLMFLNVFTVTILARLNLLNAEEYVTLSTLVLTFTGYVNLVFLCMPLTKIRAGCLALSIVCILGSIFLMGDFFGMTAFTLKVILILLAFMLVSIPLHYFIPKLVAKIDEKIQKQKQQNPQPELPKRIQFRTKASYIDQTELLSEHTEEKVEEETTQKEEN